MPEEELICKALWPPHPPGSNPGHCLACMEYRRKEKLKLNCPKCGRKFTCTPKLPEGSTLTVWCGECAEPKKEKFDGARAFHNGKPLVGYEGFEEPVDVLLAPSKEEKEKIYLVREEYDNDRYGIIGWTDDLDEAKQAAQVLTEARDRKYDPFGRGNVIIVRRLEKS